MPRHDLSGTASPDCRPIDPLAPPQCRHVWQSHGVSGMWRAWGGAEEGFFALERGNLSAPVGDLERAIPGI